MAVLADASFLVDLARRDSGALRVHAELVSANEAILVPALAAVEYLSGFRAVEAELAKLRLGAQILPFTEEDVEVAAQLVRTARAEGRFPGWTDAFIAAMAKRRGLDVVTRKPRHFEGVAVRKY